MRAVIAFLIIVFSAFNAFGAIEVKDDGTSKGYVQRLDFGNGITVTRAGIEGDVSVGNTDFIPSADDTYDIGSTTLRWKEGFYHDLLAGDDTPKLTFWDSDGTTAYVWHLDTASANAPWQNFTLWRGTYDSSTNTFTVSPDTPLLLFNDNNDIVLPAGKLAISNSFTPSNGDDSTGAKGTAARDSNYLYVKTSAAPTHVWKRAALAAWQADCLLLETGDKLLLETASGTDCLLLERIRD